jgi:hypothetical protein
VASVCTRLVDELVLHSVGGVYRTRSQAALLRTLESAQYLQNTKVTKSTSNAAKATNAAQHCRLVSRVCYAAAGRSAVRFRERICTRSVAHES